MHLASALTCLRFKFRFGAISSFGLVSFRHFAWLFLSFRVAFSHHFVFSRRKDAITPREKNNAIIKKATRNKKRRNYIRRKDEKKKPHEETKKIRGLNGVILHGLFSSFRACFSYLRRFMRRNLLFCLFAKRYFVFSFFCVAFLLYFLYLLGVILSFLPFLNPRQKDGKN